MVETRSRCGSVPDRPARTRPPSSAPWLPVPPLPSMNALLRYPWRRRKSVAAPAGGGDSDATAPSSSGRPAAATNGAIDYADLYRQEHLRQQRDVQASFLRRWKS